MISVKHDEGDRVQHGTPFLNTAQAAAYLGLSQRLLERIRRKDKGPPYRRHSRFIRYHVDDLAAWSESSPAETAALTSPRMLHNLVLSTKSVLMDRAISASEANQQFSELLRGVADGESFTVISRGRAVARVTPIDQRGEQRSLQRLLTFVSGLPVRHSGIWSRDDLYE
jgi:prevent-host-death family protein